MSLALVFLQTTLGIVLIAGGVVQLGCAIFAAAGDADPTPGASIRPAMLGLIVALAGAFILII
jgi:hypothetical protein